MKRYMMILIMTCAAIVSIKAMSYTEAKREALYLTDKMAYELNLNAEQYEYAYEINLDYLLSLNRPADIVGVCYHHRCADLRDILHDWQYKLFLAADYFLRPVIWEHTHWTFPVYHYYVRDHFFYSCPRVYYSYRGGHHTRHHHHSGFYCGRRPKWNKGFRGTQRNKIHHSHGPKRPDKTFSGNGYHFSLPQNERPAHRPDKDNNKRPGRTDREYHKRPPVNTDKDYRRPSTRKDREETPGFNKFVRLDHDTKRPVAQPTTGGDHSRVRGNRPSSSDTRNHSARSSFRNSSTRTTVQRSTPSSSPRRANVSPSGSKGRNTSGPTRNPGNERERHDSRRGR